MTDKPEPLLWLDDHRGIYIPRDFASSFLNRSKHVEGVNADDWKILETGPDHEYYWDVWIEVSDNAIVTDENGVKYRLYQDGDLWLIPVGMEWNDETETFEWSDEQ
jgi:hypothetical protein